MEVGMRKKHRRDHNQPKQGWVGGNPRYGKANGFHKGQRAATKRAALLVANNKGE